MKVQQAIDTIITYGQECRKGHLPSQKEAVTSALSGFWRLKIKMHCLSWLKLEWT